MSSSYYFLVYNDNSHTEYLNNLLNSVRKMGKEFKIIIFNKTNIDTNFLNKYKSILNLKQGGGYWLWKPYIINETLKNIKENDIIFYLDSKYFFINHFYETISNYMKINDILVWKNKPNEKVWYMKNFCKMDVILKYNMYNKVFVENCEDCWGGAIVIKKNKNTIKYIHEWLDMCSIYENITDTPSKSKNSNLFKSHRHDQSLLSIILHKYNINMKYFKKDFLQNVRCPF
tara:strand:- start:45 stop:734 length:690 start_codon:yes stop_codon:yes gene_type:complete